MSAMGSEKMVTLSNDLRELIKKYYGKIKMGMVRVSPTVNIPDADSLLKLLATQHNMILEMRHEMILTTAICRTLVECLPDEVAGDVVNAVDKGVRSQMQALEEGAKEDTRPHVILPGG